MSNRPLSLPSRERGLKPLFLPVLIGFTLVAPFTGAWIETIYGDDFDAIFKGRSLHGSVD